MLRAMKYTLLTLVAVVAVLGAAHAYSLEGLHGRVFARVMEEDTIYAPGFNDVAFRRVHRGMSEADVIREVAPPLGEVWFYDDGSVTGASVGFAGNRVDHADRVAHPLLARVAAGATKDDVRKMLGEPREKSFVYSQSKVDKSYHVRAVIFRDGRVTERLSEFYVD
jgi:hypothetical protein